MCCLVWKCGYGFDGCHVLCVLGDDDINRVWDCYQTQLQHLFDTYKHVYHYTEDERIIFKGRHTQPHTH